jgi:hypothetical protein
MSALHVVTFLSVAGSMIPASKLVARGYERRRDFWTRGSWVSFAGVVSAELLLLSASVIAELGIMLGMYSRSSMGPGARVVWIVMALASMFGGAILLSRTLRWFAYGNPRSPFRVFPLARRLGPGQDPAR